jgi:RHH-type transcriptional regulator, rel operon repressor / antitoxin RelB
MAMTTISFRIDDEKRDSLDQVANNLERDRSWVLNEAIDRYLAQREWERKHILQGIAETDADKGLTTEEVSKRLEQYMAGRSK